MVLSARDVCIYGRVARDELYNIHSVPSLPGTGMLVEDQGEK